jgi:hypothetical protein
MNSFSVSLLGAIGLDMARERFPKLEAELHRSAHNAYTSSLGNVQQIIHLAQVDIGGFSLSCTMFLKGGIADLGFALDAPAWQMTEGRLSLKDIPEAIKLELANRSGSTLAEVGAIQDNPWAGMRYIGTEGDEDHDEYSEGPPWFSLLVPDLRIQNTAGSLTHQGLKTWTGEWT